jgi:hypothetical protein
LLDLAAGRGVASLGQEAGLVESAFEHRMAGLLHSAVAGMPGALPPEASGRLAEADTRQWARNRMVGSVAGRLVALAGEVGVRLAVIKGVALEATAYARIGERPTWDVDVVVEPTAVGRVHLLVAAAQPNHPLLPHLPALVEGGRLQSVDLVYGGLPVDLHLDPLKLELVRTRQPEAWWERVRAVEVEGTPLPTFDPATALILALAHLNKDRFRYLIGYADVARLLPLVTDWDWVTFVLGHEGLSTPLWSTLRVVEETLGVTAPVGPPARSLGSAVWRVAWPARVRLLGAPAGVRYRYRQFLIPFTGRGRSLEALAGWLRRIVPPRPLLDAYYPGRGPYVWKLVGGRVLRRLRRLRQRRQLTRADRQRA